MPAPVRALALLLLTASGALSLGAAPACAESFPMSASLAPRVDFWTRVYSEVGTNGGLIHDNEDLSLVYEVVRVPAGSSDRTVERAAEDAKASARNALRKLGGGQRQNLSAAEQRILAQFPPGVSSQTLRAAAERVRFQRGQSDKFRDGLRRQGRWESHIRRALRERGVPEDLKALPHVESSYNPDANSHAGAAGLWQFTRPTGRLYMRVDYVVDERRDPFHASEAAARLLRNNYERLGTWPLAITAYNHGPGGLAKAVRQLGTRDLGTIVARYRSPSFGFASRNFYAEFLAARRIDQSPERYFGPIRREPPADHESVVLRQSYGAQALAKALHIPAAELQDWNPALLSPVWTGARNVPAAYELRVPRRSGHPPASQLVAGIQGQGYQGAPEPARVAQRSPAAAGGVHRVQPGETLGEIAERYGTSSQELADLNGIRNPKALREGQVLEVPGGAEETAAAAPTAERAPTRAAEVATLHRVARGETLLDIARRYEVSMAQIAARNDIRDPRDLREGQALEIPAPHREGEAAPELARAEPPVAPAPSEAAPAPEAEAEAAAEPTRETAASTQAAPAPEPAAAVTQVAKAPAPADPPAAEPPPPAPLRHTIAPGDTLGSVARSYGIDAQRLADANGIDDPRRLRVGAELEIPAGGTAPAEPAPAPTPAPEVAAREVPAAPAPAEPPAPLRHTIAPGDTLGSVARSYGVDAQRLADANGVDDPRRLRIGQQLEIPAGGTAPAEPAPAPTPAPEVAAREVPAAPAPAEPPAPLRHTIAPGDTLGSVARSYGVDAQRLADANGVDDPRRLRIGQQLEIPAGGSAPVALARSAPPAPPAEPPPAAPSAEPETVRVRPGDTLGSIARQAGVSAASLAEANGIDDPRRLRPGQRLTLPGGAPGAAPAEARYYTVRQGDTLYSIAARHGLRVADIARRNGLRDHHKLSIGQRLELPSS